MSRLTAFKEQIRQLGIERQVNWTTKHPLGGHLESWTLTKPGSRSIMQFIVHSHAGGYDLYEWSQSIEISKDVETISNHFKQFQMNKYTLAIELIGGTLDWSNFSEGQNAEQLLVVYDTYEEAKADLDDHIMCVNWAYKKGFMSEGYQGDMKVIKCEVVDGYATHPEIEERIKVE